MATRRRVYIDKIKKGSKFRTLLGAATGGAIQSAKYIYANFPTFTINITVAPTFAKFLPLSQEWQALQKAYLGKGTAAPQDYTDSLKRFEQENKNTLQRTVGAIYGAVFTSFIFDNKTHFIGTINNGGKIIRTP